MPFAEINLTPGVDVESSPAGNPSGVQESTFIRWRAKLPEKRGGCTLYIQSRLDGTPVSLKPWGDFQGSNYLGIATPNLVYRYNATTTELRDISPQLAVSALATPVFTTGVGSRYVLITDATEPGVTRFDSVQFVTPVSVGGLILNGTYPVYSSSGSNTFTIEAAYPAATAVTSVAGTLASFETISGLSQVIVTFPIQYQFESLSVGDRIGFFGTDAIPSQPLTTVGGIPIIGSYVVTEILGPTQFVFQAQYLATTTDTKTMNNGFVYLNYWITEPPGYPPP